MTKRLLILATALTVGISAYAMAHDNTPTTAPSQIKKCCVDDKGHYHPEWAHGINCPHNHKFCK